MTKAFSIIIFFSGRSASGENFDKKVRACAFFFGYSTHLVYVSLAQPRMISGKVKFSHTSARIIHSSNNRGNDKL